MKKTMALAAAALTTVLVATGCAGADRSAADSPQPRAAQSVDGDATQQFLARHGLAGQPVEQIVDRLDRTLEDRAAGPTGSVRPNELVLSDDRGKVSLPIEGKFYLAFAPYVNRTHECFNHNLATCQGELVEQPLTVTITTDDGRTLVDESLTTFTNGFAGVWLPKDITGRITVEHDGRSASAPLSTGAEDPTCLTTLRLT